MFHQFFFVVYSLQLQTSSFSVDLCMFYVFKYYLFKYYKVKFLWSVFLIVTSVRSAFFFMSTLNYCIATSCFVLSNTDHVSIKCTSDWLVSYLWHRLYCFMGLVKLCVMKKHIDTFCSKQMCTVNFQRTFLLICVILLSLFKSQMLCCYELKNAVDSAVCSWGVDFLPNFVSCHSSHLLSSHPFSFPLSPPLTCSKIHPGSLGSR